MPAYTGRQICRSALREIGVIDPIEGGDAELFVDVLEAITDMLDSWRNDRLTIGGITRSVYSLTANQQSYTIGSGGNFNQDYPNDIPTWSVIPDDTATDPQEISKGRPYNYEQWQAVTIKSQTSSYPVRMYFDKSWTAGLGRCLFHPIQTGSNVDVVLYSAIPAITSIALNTSYDLRPGAARAIKLNGAIEIADRKGREVPTTLIKRAADALASYKRTAMIFKESPMRAEFAIGQSGRVLRVRSGLAG